MEYVILDLKFADVILPSFYEVNAIRIKNDIVIDRCDILINPGCEFQPDMIARYGITQETIDQCLKSGTIAQMWSFIVDFIDGDFVFMYRAQSRVSSLMKLLSIENIKPPNFMYGCVESLINSQWKDDDLKFTTLESVENYFNLNYEDRIDNLRYLVSHFIEMSSITSVKGLINRHFLSSGGILFGEKKIRKANNLDEMLFMYQRIIEYKEHQNIHKL